MPNEDQPGQTITTEKTADKPHPDQAKYWDKDLELKKRAIEVSQSARCISRIALLISIFGFGAVLYSLHNNDLSLQKNEVTLKENGLALRNNVQQSMVKLTTDLDRVYIDKPYMLDYIFNNSAVNTNSTNYAEACCVVTMELDVFDIAASQSETFKDQWKTPEAWTNWIVSDFSSSRILRNVYAAHPNWWGKDMIKYYQIGLNNSSAKN
jgi:hypothetical protein